MSTSISPNSRSLTLASLLLLGACAAPDLGPRPEMFVPPVSVADQEDVDPQSLEWFATLTEAKWWTKYGDPQLDELMAEALSSSPDLAIASARARMASSHARGASAALPPTLSASGDAVMEKRSYNDGIPPDFVPEGWNDGGQLSLAAAFDLDLWGEKRAALAAATNDATAAKVDEYQARIMLTSTILDTYIRFATALAEYDLLSTDVEEAQHIAVLYRQRADRGLENQGAVRLAQAREGEARFALEAKRTGAESLRLALAELTGNGPERARSIERPHLDPADYQAAITAPPAALAARRPDIIGARLRVQARDMGVLAAERSYLPRISLDGLIGMSSLGLANLFTGGSTYGTAGVGFDLPIFDGGRRDMQFRTRRAEYDLAVAEYNRSVIAALTEIADNWQMLRGAKSQALVAAGAAEDATSAYQVVLQRYRAGLADSIAVGQAQMLANEARRSAIRAEFRFLQAEAGISRALGGGFTLDQDQTNGLER